MANLIKDVFMPEVHELEHRGEREGSGSRGWMTYDLALVSAREGHAVLLKLDNSAGSLLAHHLDRVLQKSVCFRERKVSGMKMGFAAHAQALPEGRRGCGIWWEKVTWSPSQSEPLTVS